MILKLVRRSFSESGVLCNPLLLLQRILKKSCLPTRQALLIMKLTAIILLSACLTASAKGFGQRISLSEKNAYLPDVFKKIERQTDYTFAYTGSQLSQAKRVTVEINNGSLEQVLALCFKDQPFTYTIIERTIVVKPKKEIPNEPATIFEPPPIDIKGRVVNEKGDPVEGATVTVKGTKNATATDANGVFILKAVDENATIVISGVNIETYEVKIAGKTDLATLKVKTKVTTGEDVTVQVNTGYQQIPKERATGSFDFIDNKSLNEQVSTNILTRLESLATSFIADKRLFTTSNPIYIIRGLSTVNADIRPLIVVDNFPYEGDINNINPNFIESITILKDAAAASIWGTRAGNGVIVITTRKGQFNKPLKIDFNSNITIVEKPDLFYLQNISSTDFIDVETMLYQKGFYNSKFTSTSRPPISPVVEILRKRTLGQITASDSAAQIDALRGLDVRNDFNKYSYQKVINQQYALTIAGGTNNIAYSFSGGYDKNVNMLDAEYSRLNFRSENRFKPFKNFQISADVFYTQNRNKSGSLGYGFVKMNPENIPPYSRLADENGNPLAVISKYRKFYIDTAGNGKLLDWKYYPLQESQLNTTTDKTQDILGNLGIQYNFLSHFSADAKYQYEKQQTTTQTLYDRNSFFARDLINLYSQISGSQVTYKIPNGSILDLGNSFIESQAFRGQLGYSNNWSNHTIVGFIGSEIREKKISSNSFRTYGYDPDRLSSVNVDYANQYPTYITKSNAFIPNPANFSDITNRFVSYYGNAAYTYKGRYTISGSARRDGSNLFGAYTNNKWTPLWSAGLSWDISKESFYKTSLFPYLKLRATYGFSGNIDPNQAGVTTLMNGATSPFTLGPTATFATYINPELRWEKIGMFNVGVDFRMKKNIITGSIEYYRKKAKDLYGSTPVDQTVGLVLTAITKNVASIKGNGIDLELNSLNLNSAIKWTTTLNLSYYKDKVVDYYLSSTQGNSFVNGQRSIGLPGYPVYGVYSYKWGGLDSLGNPRGYLNKVLSTDWTSLTGSGTQFTDLVFNGRAFPTLWGSLGNTISYKGFSLNIAVLYKFGFYFRRNSINYFSLYTTYTGHSDFALRWRKPGDEINTTIPSMIYPAASARDAFYSGSEILVEKGDHIRLQYITLSYELTKQHVNKFPFERVQLYINANNLGIIWSSTKYDIDPDYGDRSIPPSKSIAVGLRASF